MSTALITIITFFIMLIIRIFIHHIFEGKSQFITYCGM